jgi:hypothetical protein
MISGRNEPMNRLDSAELTKQRGRSFTPQLDEGTAAEPLEVNVIFTDLDGTAAALKTAESFARDLGAHIRLRAGLVVPVQLPLDQPLVSVEFLKKVLQELVNRSEPDGLERTAHLYICRDWTDTLSEVLKPDSVVVIGVHKRWWPTSASRLARVLRANHNRVIVVNTNRRQNECQEDAIRERGINTEHPRVRNGIFPVRRRQHRRGAGEVKRCSISFT